MILPIYTHGQTVLKKETEEIDENVFYRTLSASFVANGLVFGAWTCYVVENLPETGEDAIRGDLTNMDTW